VKSLRYNLSSDRAIACAVLTDTREEPVPLFPTREAAPDYGDKCASSDLITQRVPFRDQ